MRILITGSRTWTDPKAIHDALNEVFFASTCTDHVTVVHGACPRGPDAIAADWVKAIRTAEWLVTEERHPADWRAHGAGAGFRRNAEMVNAGADLCLAFIDPCDNRDCDRTEPHGSHGASHTADLAEKAGIETRRFPS